MTDGQHRAVEERRSRMMFDNARDKVSAWLQSSMWRRDIKMKPWLLIGLLIFMGIIGGVSGAMAAPDTPPPVYTDQCVREAKANGGFTLDCDPILTPTGSPTGSPSASPSVSPSPSMSTSASPSPSTSTSTSTSPSPSPSTSTSTSPSPSPSTSTTAPRTGCLALPSACGFPDATNTGASGALTVVNGSVTLSKAGEVYQGKEVKGCILVTAANVTIRNVKVTGNCFYNIDYYPSGTGTLTVEDTTIVCGSPRGTGIGEWQFVARRINVSGCENGFDVDRDATIVDSYCHNLTAEYGDPGPHTDCVQGTMTRNVTITHNTLYPGMVATSAIEGDCGTCAGILRTGWTVSNNLLAGGGYTLYCTNRSAETGSVVSGNRFGPSGYSSATGCRKSTVTWAGNVRDDNNATIQAG